MRVLIVEDSDPLAHTLCKLVERAGQQVECAGDGEQALSIAAVYHPDLVLLDIGLPGLDGYAVAKRLRRDAGHEAMKIVAISGYLPDQFEMVESGIDEYRIKPIDLAALQPLLQA